MNPVSYDIGEAQLVERANQQAGSSICTHTWQHLVGSKNSNLLNDPDFTTETLAD